MYGCTCGELINEAKAKRASKDYNKAILILEKAVDSIVCDDCVSVKCHEVYYELGITYEIMKDYNKALKCYKKALQISGYNALYERCIKRIEKNDSRN